MAQDLYCWRCDKVVAMLDEQEWEAMEPALTQSIIDIQNHCKAGATLQEALRMPHGLQAIQLYKEITGHSETNPDVFVAIASPSMGRHAALAANHCVRHKRRSVLPAGTHGVWTHCY